MATQAFYVGQADYLTKLNTLYDIGVVSPRNAISATTDTLNTNATGTITYSNTTGVITLTPKTNELP